MLIRVEQNRMGDVTLAPVNPRWARAIVRHLRAMNAIPVADADDTSVWAEPTRDGSIYLQGHRGDAFLDNDIPRAVAAHIRRGYSARIRMDAYSYLTMVGYDAADAVTINTSRPRRGTRYLDPHDPRGGAR